MARGSGSSNDTAAAGGGESTKQLLATWLFSPLQGVRAGDWLRMLTNHGFRIGPMYWPRTAFATGFSLFNSVLARIESLRYDRTLAQTPVTRPLFVLGHHRSGTTHLWNLLTQDDRFAYPSILQATFPHTFLLFEGAIRGLAKRMTMKKRPQDNVELDPDGPIEEEKAICAATAYSIQMARHFPREADRHMRWLTMHDTTPQQRAAWMAALDRFARKLLLRQGTDRTIVFKSPDHTAKIRLLLELYPDARFLHIHRDPYTVFRSTRKMERTTMPLFAFQRPDARRLDDFILARYRQMYDAFFADVPRIPTGQFAEVSYDAIVADPLGQLEHIYDTLDLGDFAAARPGLAAYVAGQRGYRRNTYTALPEGERQRVYRAWRPVFERYGYPA